jgi:hypothetical protein
MLPRAILSGVGGGGSGQVLPGQQVVEIESVCCNRCRGPIVVVVAQISNAGRTDSIKPLKLVKNCKTV